MLLIWTTTLQLDDLDYKELKVPSDREDLLAREVSQDCPEIQAQLDQWGKKENLVDQEHQVNPERTELEDQWDQQV